MSARQIIREAVIANVTRSPTTKTNAILEALTAAGYRILAPGELDGVTIERCAMTLVSGVYASKHDVSLAMSLADALRSLSEQKP